MPFAHPTPDHAIPGCQHVCQQHPQSQHVWALSCRGHYRPTAVLQAALMAPGRAGDTDTPCLPPVTHCRESHACHTGVTNMCCSRLKCMFIRALCQSCRDQQHFLRHAQTLTQVHRCSRRPNKPYLPACIPQVALAMSLMDAPDSATPAGAVAHTLCCTE